jgi:GNAT superfamily N-acetyltransferase
MRIAYRTAVGEADFALTYELFLRAANDLRAKSHRERLEDTDARRVRALAFREHAFAHDSAGFWIAEYGGEPVGFGIATARPGFWHLNALHVLPEYQGSGVGTGLLQRCMAYGRTDQTVFTVISEAAQPVSNAMYARAGMYQWLPLVHMDCATFHTRSGAQVFNGKAGATLLAAIDRIDEVVLGFTRSVDHAFWTGLPDVSVVMLGSIEQPDGYAYVSTFGGIGPIAVRAADSFPDLLAQSIHHAAEHGLERVSFVIPGLASSALRYLLEHGGRYAADMTVLLSSQPFGRLSQYLLPASDALF